MSKRNSKQPFVAGGQTDQGNAERFARDHRDAARYCPETSSWYVWDGKRWAPDRMTECTVRKPGAQVQAREIYDLFSNWCDFEDVPKSSMAMFGRQLSERDIAKQRTRDGVMYQDIALDDAEFKRREAADIGWPCEAANHLSTDF